MKPFWLTLCAIYAKFSFIFVFLLTVIILNLTALLFGLTWLTLGLGLVISLTSAFFLRRLIIETYIDLAEKEYKIPREEAILVVRKGLRKKK